MIETLKVVGLPFLAAYEGSDVPVLIIQGIHEIIGYLERTGAQQGFDSCNSYTSNLATVDLIPRLFNSYVGLLFVAGDKSSVGKSTTCLCILSSLIRLGVSPGLIAYIKPVTQCEAEQPITR